MLDSNAYTVSQKEAYLNEAKGALYEYLVARALGPLELNPESKKTLSKYQQWIYRFDPGLAKKLIEASDLMRRAIEEKYPHRIKAVKISALEKSTGEADLWLDFGHQELGLSLKYCQENSFVNTKSGGLHSFLDSYFGLEKASQELSQLGHESFSRLALDFHEMAGLPGQSHFTQVWKENFSQLPGQLPREFKERLSEYYFENSYFFFHALESLVHKNPQRFHQGLSALMGFSRQDLVQGICFYKNENFRLGLIDFEKHQKMISSFKLQAPQKNKSFFEIKLLKAILQIRLKPMNRFTVPGLKVNCSVRYDYS